MPEIRRDVPAAEWHLSPEGSARARAFAERLPLAEASRVFTSREPKAVGTADAIAGELNLTVERVAGLHEHERPLAQMLSREAFDQNIRELFARPDELVFGAETANQARRRFTLALMRLVTGTAGDVVAVSHGTVIALFVAEAGGVEPFAFWKRQEMPYAVSLSLPDLRLQRTIFLNG